MTKLAILKATALALIIPAILGCRILDREPTTEFSPQKFKDGRPNLTRLSGTIETVRELEVFSQEEGEIVMTLIGFSSGDGVILRGLYPGLSEGKRVNLYVNRLADQYKGTPIHDVIRIAGLESAHPLQGKPLTQRPTGD